MVLSMFLPEAIAVLAFAFAPSPRPEIAYGTPTPVSSEHSGYVRGHCGKYTAWVAEYLTADLLAGSSPRAGNDFTEDPEVPCEFRARLKDYKGSPYDRGHIAPAADFHGDPMAMRECFLLSNMMPQTKQLNEYAWARLEKHVRELASAPGAECWIFTGPAWLPRKSGSVKFKTIGESKTWVPTHCWKAVLLKRGDRVELYGWLLPNVDEPPDDFNDGAVAIDEIEAAAGLDLFSGLDDDLEDALEANSTTTSRPRRS